MQSFSLVYQALLHFFFLCYICVCVCVCRYTNTLLCTWRACTTKTEWLLSCSRNFLRLKAVSAYKTRYISLSVRVLLLRGLARYVTSIIGLSTPTAWVSVLHHIHTPSHTLSSISLTYVECLCVTRALAHHLYRVWGLSLPCIVCMSTLSPGTYIHTYV